MINVSVMYPLILSGEDCFDDQRELHQPETALLFEHAGMLLGRFARSSSAIIADLRKVIERTNSLAGADCHEHSGRAVDSVRGISAGDVCHIILRF